jgi:hypothetical protein
MPSIINKIKKMKTKTILIYGAIAAGAYLAYKYFMKPKAEANFANANGG